MNISNPANISVWLCGNIKKAYNIEYSFHSSTVKWSKTISYCYRLVSIWIN